MMEDDAKEWGCRDVDLSEENDSESKLELQSEFILVPEGRFPSTQPGLGCLEGTHGGLDPLGKAEGEDGRQEGDTEGAESTMEDRWELER